jgi:hypothetical protein
MADEAITVEIEKEAPAPEGVTQKVETNGGAPPVKNEALEDLRSQYKTLQAETERERGEKAAALLRVNEEAAGRQRAEQERDQTRTEVTESRLDTVEQGIAAAKTEADAAEAAYTAAQEAGDWKRAAQEQRKLARAEARSAQLEVAKADLEIAKTQAPIRRQQEQQRTAADPVEAFIGGRDTGTQAWLRSHPDEARILATDPTSRRGMKINAADADAVAEGLTRGTTDYFQHVEKFLGMTKEQPRQQQQRRSSTAPVAPVQNGGGGMNGGGRVVNLTAAEARSATDGTLIFNYNDPTGKNRFKKGDPIGIEEMARRKAALQDGGQYDKTFLEN